MSTRRLDQIWDWCRWGYNLHMTCRQCGRVAVLDPHAAHRYFVTRGWHTTIAAGAMLRFRCAGCGTRGGVARPTNAEVTVQPFPADERGWKTMQRRLRG